MPPSYARNNGRWTSCWRWPRTPRTCTCRAEPVGDRRRKCRCHGCANKRASGGSASSLASRTKYNSWFGASRKNSTQRVGWWTIPINLNDLFLIGTYQLGWRWVEVFANMDSFGGTFNMNNVRTFKRRNMSDGKDANTRDQLQKIARMIDEELPDGWGFMIFAFPFNESDGRLNYVANAPREDAIKVLKEWLDKQKSPDNFGKHV